MIEEETTRPGLQPGQLAAVAGVGVAAAAVWLVPLLLGPVAAGLGVVAVIRGERRGRWVIALAVVCTVAGVVLSLLPTRLVYS